MYPLYYDTIQAMFDHLYPKQEALVIPEAWILHLIRDLTKTQKWVEIMANELNLF